MCVVELMCAMLPVTTVSPKSRYNTHSARNYYKQITMSIVLHQLARQLGAAVYIGEYNGQKCIFKFLRSEDSYQHVNQEADVTKALEDTDKVPRVLKMLHNIQHTEDGLDYDALLVLEYIEGSDLSDVDVNIPLARRLCLEIISGVEEFISRGIVHNDLKLDNIRWTGDKVVFIDFGCAYSAEYHDFITWYQIKQHDYMLEGFEAECNKLKSFISASRLLYYPPECDLEDSISHPGSFYLEREYRDVVTNCILLLLERAGDCNGYTAVMCSRRDMSSVTEAIKRLS